METKLQRLAEQTARCQADRDELTQARRTLDAERARLEEFAVEQSEQLARMEREREWGPAVALPGPDAEEEAEEEAEESIVSGAFDVPVMGQQFENVDPVLLGEPHPSASAAAAATLAEPKKAAPERIPVDPAADEAYEELVDRLVQFNYSKKKRWYKFW